MSRSVKKKPFTGFTTCKSEQHDKKIASRIVRRVIKQVLNQNPVTYTHIDRKTLRYNNVWAFGKDGKHYFGNLKESDKTYFFRLMRK